MSAVTIIAKALRCIDEVYPAVGSINFSEFPVEEFLDEAVRWVVDVVPTSALTIREKLVLDKPTVSTDGVGKGVWPSGKEGRLVYFMAEGWKRHVVGAINENNPLYLQQNNKVLRGNPSRPIVTETWSAGDALRKTLCWYTTDSTEYDAYYVPYDAASIPEALEALAAWKLAETVLLSMSDADSALVCTSKVNEQLEILAL